MLSDTDKVKLVDFVTALQEGCSDLIFAYCDDGIDFHDPDNLYGGSILFYLGTLEVKDAMVWTLLPPNYVHRKTGKSRKRISSYFNGEEFTEHIQYYEPGSAHTQISDALDQLCERMEGEFCCERNYKKLDGMATS